MTKEIPRGAWLALAVLFLSGFGFVFSWGQSRLQPSDLFSVALQDLAELLSAPGILFALVFFPVWAASLLVLTRYNEPGLANAAGLLSVILPIALLSLWFSHLGSFWPVWLCLVLSIPFIVEITRVRWMELKKYVVLRIFSSSMKYAGLALAIGFIALAYWSIETNDLSRLEYQQKFREQILAQAGQNPGDSATLAKRLAQTNAALIVETQLETLRQIKQWPSYRSLERQSGDAVAGEFVSNMEYYSSQIATPAYANEIAKQTEKNVELTTQNLLENLKEQNPLFKNLENNIWLLHAALWFGILTLLSNTLFLAMGLFAGYLIAIAQDHLDPPKETGETNRV